MSLAGIRPLAFKDFNISDFKQMKDLLEEIPQYQFTLEEKVEKISNAKLTLDDLEQLLNKKEFVKEMLGILRNTEVYSHFQHIA